MQKREKDNTAIIPNENGLKHMNKSFPIFF